MLDGSDSGAHQPPKKMDLSDEFNQTTKKLETEVNASSPEVEIPYSFELVRLVLWSICKMSSTSFSSTSSISSISSTSSSSTSSITSISSASSSSASSNSRLSSNGQKLIGRKRKFGS